MYKWNQEDHSMNKAVEPLISDEYTGEPPSKRVLAYIWSRRI